MRDCLRAHHSTTKIIPTLTYEILRKIKFEDRSLVGLLTFKFDPCFVRTLKFDSCFVLTFKFDRVSIAHNTCLSGT